MNGSKALPLMAVLAIGFLVTSVAVVFKLSQLTGTVAGLERKVEHMEKTREQEALRQEETVRKIVEKILKKD